jgi:hypothetical protein
MNFRDKRGQFGNLEKLPGDPETAQALGLTKPAGAVILANRVQKIIEADPSGKRLNQRELKKRIDDIMTKGEDGLLGPDWFVEMAIGFAVKKYITELSKKGAVAAGTGGGLLGGYGLRYGVQKAKEKEALDALKEYKNKFMKPSRSFPNLRDEIII